MKTHSKKGIWDFAHRLRRLFGRSFSGFSRTGRVFQILWDAASLQRKQRHYLIQIGERAVALYRSQELRDLQIERLIARIDRSDRLLKRQELQLSLFQQKRSQDLPREAKELEPV